MSTTISGDTGIDKVQDNAITPTGSVSRIKTFIAQNSTSGTSIDFTGIPSWAKKITVMFNGVSTSGTSLFLVQVGSGIVDITGYISSASTTTTTTGFIQSNAQDASSLVQGISIFQLITGNTWLNSSMIARQASSDIGGRGSKTLSGTLDRIRVTTVNGTDIFDAGQINVLVEG